MDFSKKLTFLLTITNTSNLTLADALDVKPSIISLYKTGKRGTPKKTSTLKRFADYFSTRFTTDYQIQALAEITEYSPIIYSHTDSEIAEVLLIWLSDGTFSTPNPISQILNALENPEPSADYNSLSPHRYESFIHTGREGKRIAIRNFLQHILAVENPTTLYIQADDDCEWLLSDSKLLFEFTDVMYKMHSKGCKIIHFLPPFSNGQLMDILIGWIPIYRLENVDSYYYPRFRDNSFRTMLFVLEGEVALTSLGIYNTSSQSATYLHTSPQTVEIYTNILKDYQRLCRPALKIIRNRDDIDNAYRRQTGVSTPMISMRYLLPAELLPQELLHKTLNQINSSQVNNYIYQSLDYDESLYSQSVVDICRISTAKEVMDGSIHMIAPYSKSPEWPHYTLETYILHLKNILHQMETHENYCFVPISPDDTLGTVFVRKGVSAIIRHRHIDPAIFEITETDLVRVIEEYLEQKMGSVYAGPNGRKASIKKLKQIISELEKEL